MVIQNDPKICSNPEIPENPERFGMRASYLFYDSYLDNSRWVNGFEKELAERVGFEPTVLVKVHTLSKRAP